MIKLDKIKVLGLAATIIGAGAGLLSDYVSEKKMNDAIEEKVKEAMATKENDEEEEQ